MRYLPLILILCAGSIPKNFGMGPQENHNAGLKRTASASGEVSRPASAEDMHIAAFLADESTVQRDMALYHFADYSKDAYAVEKSEVSGQRSAVARAELATFNTQPSTNAEDGPQTWPAIVSWDKQTNATSFTLIVGDFMLTTNANVVSNVPVQLGTNAVTCIALNAKGSAQTNKTFFLLTHRDIYPKAFSADSSLGPRTTLTALPGVITDPVADKYFGWEILQTNRLDGRLLP